MRYRPYHEVAGIPHVVADGASRRSTALTLSHWPDSGTPDVLKDDLSAQIAFRYLDSPPHHVDVEAVTNNHLDIDGFVAVLALDQPDEAQARRDLLIEVARAGDFACTPNRDAARIAMTIGALREPARSPLPKDVLELQTPYVEAAEYRWLLDHVFEITDDLDQWRHLWQHEDDLLSQADAAFDDGRITIEERPEVDLAVVRIDPAWSGHVSSRSSLQGFGPCHPMAVHNRTERSRIVYAHGDRFGLVYRFESWVDFRSRPIPARVDLTDFATELTVAERQGTSARWVWAWPATPNPPVPWLRFEGDGPSALPLADFLTRLEDALATGQPIVTTTRAAY